MAEKNNPANIEHDADALRHALLNLDKNAAELILQKNTGGIGIAVEKILVPTLEKIGHDWEHGELALAQVYMCGRICEELMEKMLPRAAQAPRKQPVMAIASFRDYHMLGKRLVCSVLRSAGYVLLDYGRVDIEDMIARCRHDKVELLFLSALMLSSALAIKDAIAALRHAGLNVRVAVGGAPFRYDSQLGAQVGADETGMVSADALTIAERATERRS